MSRRDPVPMGEEEWRDLEAAFEEASRLQGEALDAFLHELASRKPRLAEEVASMLAAAAASGETRFASPELAPGLAPGGAEETWLGRDVGPFRIEALIGEGGMGRVFLAERREGFSQTVAVKMLRGAMEGTVFARRFLRERATLARLNHPHIAGLVDGGALEDGTPWLAMEHVSGRTLLEHCEEAGLGLPARVDLLIQVVDALQFAHQQLVVHRDVKPSNILVATGEHAMLLDFGISKLLEEGPEEGEELTLPQAPLYTPEYASPEQMRGEAVGTTSDIYAAGVVLFRLASGRLPFDGEGVTRFEWTRMVSEQDAPPLRSVAPRAPRDLEAIVARCLAREPERRYPSAAALAEDLRRWRRGLPVQARPDSVWYRLRRLVLRNRAASLLALLVLVVSSLGLAAWIDQSRVAQRRGLTASRVSEFLVDFFSQGDPWATSLADVRLVSFFGADLDRRLAELEDEPEVQRDLAAALGRVVLNLGEEERAIELLSRALDAEGQGAADPVVRADILFDRGVSRRRMGDLEGAAGDLRRALRLRATALGETHEEVASAWNTLGLVHHTMGDAEQARVEYLRALELREALHGEDGEPLASTLNNLAALDLGDGRVEEAFAAFRRARRIQEAAYQEAHPDLATTINNLGFAHQALGELDLARQHFQEALEMRRACLPADHPHLAGSLNNLGLIEEEEGRPDEAAKLFREALDLAERKAPEGHPLLSQIRENLAAVSG